MAFHAWGVVLTLFLLFGCDASPALYGEEELQDLPIQR